MKVYILKSYDCHWSDSCAYDIGTFATARLAIRAMSLRAKQLHEEDIERGNNKYWKIETDEDSNYPKFVQYEKCEDYDGNTYVERQEELYVCDVFVQEQTVDGEFWNPQSFEEQHIEAEGWKKDLEAECENMFYFETGMKRISEEHATDIEIADFEAVHETALFL